MLYALIPIGLVIDGSGSPSFIATVLIAVLAAMNAKDSS